MTTSSCRRQFVKTLRLLVIHAAVGSTFTSLDRPSELWTSHSQKEGLADQDRHGTPIHFQKI